ncbi:hypothetical protein [Phaeobacter sp. J2-8]|uniref:SEL1-like repeat protein n=1 Tax=Phaeobacter sp. J2-8 TaxID=2931394 RepID=UPI001FD13B4F|nr:hypothetical protein [Phaeobacter sp. J2-8]MCJ7874793.1 hypothetical protein [Phaeobacter sp. J2-8]
MSAQSLPSEVTEALERGDYFEARTALAPLAANENAQAQYQYGILLLRGQGGPLAFEDGIVMLESAAAQDHTLAALLLARLYLTGSAAGAPHDPERAAEFLAIAAAQNNGEAQYYLGLLYQSGSGVAKDPARAFSLFQRAAETGDREAQYELSKAYANGQGTDIDKTEALRWLRVAADSGQAEAQFFLANALNTGRGVARDQAEAQKWYRRAAENGIPLAQRILGGQYLTGDDITAANPKEALRWLGLAAEAGDPGAMHNLAMAYGGEYGIARDDAKALLWYGRASEAGLARSTYALAHYYEQGRGVPANMEQAALTYRKALEQGEDRAGLRLGYLTGQGLLDPYMPPHFGVDWALAAARTGDADARSWLQRHADNGLRTAQTAFALLLLDDAGQAADAAPYLEQAAMAGDVTAQFEVGTLYTTGLGVTLDYVQAHKWLNIAAASGHEKARERRDVLGDLMTGEQIAAAQTAARVFFETASERLPEGVAGNRRAQ